MSDFTKISTENVVKCECCGEDSLSGLSMFKWNPPSIAFIDIKTIYCEKCKSHPNNEKCPNKF